MSAWLEMADAIQARLGSLAALGGVDIIVDRQKSISTLVGAAVGKAKGACVTVLFDGARMEDDSGLQTTPRYVVRLYARPVIRDGDAQAAAADDILEAMLGALHGWSPRQRPSCYERLDLTGGPDLLPDPKFLIYEITLTARVKLPDPVFLTTTP